MTQNGIQKQSGNVLIILLIAIFVLGGLTALVTSMGGQTEETGSTEKDRINASQILSYAGGIENAVTQMRLRGCSEREINFDNSILAGKYVNALAPADDSCDVFEVAGGGQTYTAPKTAWLDSTNSAEPEYGNYFFTGRTWVANLPSSGNTTSELLLILPYITRNTCAEINRILGVPNQSNGEPPADHTAGHVASMTTFFIGTYTNGNSLDSDGSGSTAISGKKSGCVLGNRLGTTDRDYFFFKALIVR